MDNKTAMRPFDHECELCHTTFSMTYYEHRELMRHNLANDDGIRIDACPACFPEALRRSDESRKLRKRKQREETWMNEVCPPLYGKTDLNHIGLSQKVRAALDAWEPSGGIGVGIIGATGKGKTRLLFSRLKPLFIDGWDIVYLSSVRLEAAIHRSFSFDDDARREAEKAVQRAHGAEILFLDDVGKEKFTERVASQFYELIEHRTSMIFTTVWTTNATANDLKARLGDDKGEPIVRRLKEFSTIIEA